MGGGKFVKIVRVVCWFWVQDCVCWDLLVVDFARFEECGGRVM